MTTGTYAGVTTGTYVPDVTDADRVVAAVNRCPSVARMSGGKVGEVATYLPGRRVAGVVIRQPPSGPEVSVHVVGRYGPNMRQISREVDSAVHSVLPGHRVLITIDDLDIVDGDSAVPD